MIKKNHRKPTKNRTKATSKVKSIKKHETNTKKRSKGQDKKIRIGQTLETNDIYLPHKKNRVPKSKKRPILVVDKNEFNELVVVPGSKKKTNNTVPYNRYGLKNYRISIEIEDNEGNPIKENEKFRKTKNCSVLPESETLKIKDNVINHSRFTSENRKKYNLFINRHKKSRD